MDIFGDWRNAVLLIVVIAIAATVFFASRRRRGRPLSPPLDVSPAAVDGAFLDSSHIIGGPLIDAAKAPRDGK